MDKFANSRNHRFGGDSYAVDGTGQVIRPGAVVRIRAAMLDLYDRGVVITIDRAHAEALVQLSEDHSRTYPLYRLGRMEDDDPLWVYGTY